MYTWKKECFCLINEANIYECMLHNASVWKGQQILALGIKEYKIQILFEIEISFDFRNTHV